MAAGPELRCQSPSPIARQLMSVSLGVPRRLGSKRSSHPVGSPAPVTLHVGSESWATARGATRAVASRAARKLVVFMGVSPDWWSWPSPGTGPGSTVKIPPGPSGGSTYILVGRRPLPPMAQSPLQQGPREPQIRVGIGHGPRGSAHSTPSQSAILVLVGGGGGLECPVWPGLAVWPARCAVLGTGSLQHAG